jgi:hypothetical protein
MIALFVAAQVVSLRPKEPPVDAKLALVAPPAVSAVLQESCYDCHSDQTRWPWYEHVAPVSWFIQNHVKEGRQHLNFSIWNTYDSGRMINKLNAIRDAVKSHWMPLSSYLWIHHDAVLTPEDAKTVTSWADATARALAAQAVAAGTTSATPTKPATPAPTP